MLQGKTVLITGAASGLGRVWALGFHKEGAQVVAADINAARLVELSDLGIHTIATNVADADAVRRMVDFAVETTGRLDVQFNNAGLGYGHTIEDSPDGAFEAHVAVHLFGCVNGMRAAIPHMRRQGYGRIINTVSRAAEIPGPGNSAYSAAKAAMWSVSRAAARELRDVDIKVNMLIPGPTNTSIWGRDRPDLQGPAVTWPTALMLATLAKDGPSGKVFWNEAEYHLFHPDNQIKR
jgi:3-oxoacyl-[acyl-carrier protein] reductase